MITDRRLEQADRRAWSEIAGPMWRDARALLSHQDHNSHHVEAARKFPWQTVLPGGRRAEVLDLGCGAGWLAGLLSARTDVASVIAWDNSPKLLQDLLPETVELVGGNLDKLDVVCGDFLPLLLEDKSVDLAVMASAFHHCDDFDELLRELHRVVRLDGCVVLLNEMPYPGVSMLYWIATTCVAATLNATLPGPGLRRAGHLAADHALYDPVLGDRAMTRVQWRRLLRRHPFTYEAMDSGMSSYRPHYRQRPRREPFLTHFILRPQRSYS